MVVVNIHTGVVIYGYAIACKFFIRRRRRDAARTNVETSNVISHLDIVAHDVLFRSSSRRAKFCSLPMNNRNKKGGDLEFNSSPDNEYAAP